MKLKGTAQVLNRYNYRLISNIIFRFIIVIEKLERYYSNEPFFRKAITKSQQYYGYIYIATDKYLLVSQLHWYSIAPQRV